MEQREKEESIWYEVSAAASLSSSRSSRRSRRKADGLSLLAGFSAGALLIGTIWALTALVL